MMTETIAAISTASGMAAVGMIRISGTDATVIADRVFKSISGKKLADSKGYRAYYGKIYDENIQVDEAVALVFRSPLSYTGEDVVEISCHGGMYTTTKTLEIILKNGARIAMAGEFTKRAYLNGKMSLSEAESVMDIIKANNMQHNRAALSLKNGALHKKIKQIKEKLVSVTSHVCAYLDYPEEEIPKVEKEKLLEDIKNACTEIEQLVGSFNISKVIREGVDTAIIGKPNVGKSTLMNLLIGTERSIVTDIPGTTRDIIEESVNIGNITLRLSDTAGIHDTCDRIEQIGVEKAKEKLECSEFVLALFDASRNISADDKELILKLQTMPCVAVVNKCDLDLKFDLAYLKSKLDFVVGISARTGRGREELVATIEKFFKVNKFDPSKVLLLNERQKQQIYFALDDIKSAYNELKTNMTLDAVVYLLEQTISYLSHIDGENITEEILNDIFSNFCVGK